MTKIEQLEKLKSFEIIFVDDEEAVVALMRTIFNGLGIVSYSIAMNGKEALELVKSKRDLPNLLLITDIRMPKMSGLELVKAINDEGIKIPSIIVSAHQNVEYFDEAEELGVVNYLCKPFDMEELLYLMESKEFN